MTEILPLLALLLVAIVLVIVSTRLRFPYPIALVAFGVALGWFTTRTPIPGVTATASSLFTPGFFFDILLPPIVFEAAIHVNFRYLRERAALVLFLVLVGVLFTTFFTGILVAEIAAIPIAAALLLAAILSPTDPIAVITLLRRLGVPKELSTIVEGESLLNDAVGVMLFVVLLGAIGTGAIALEPAIAQFLWLIFGGLAIGLLAAGGVYLLHRRLNDPSVETALTVVVAYGSYLLAAGIGTSGIVATAITGIAVGTWVAPRTMIPEVLKAVTNFWSVVVYIVNSIVFLSIGLLFTVTDLLAYLPLILLVYGVLFLGRAIIVYGHEPLARTWSGRRWGIPGPWYAVITFSGVRGAIPIVLALSLLTSTTALAPSILRTILSVVLGVALLSIVVNNLLAEWYIRRTFSLTSHPGAGLSGAGE